MFTVTEIWRERGCPNTRKLLRDAEDTRGRSANKTRLSKHVF